MASPTKLDNYPGTCDPGKDFQFWLYEFLVKARDRASAFVSGWNGQQKGFFRVALASRADRSVCKTSDHFSSPYLQNVIYYLGLCVLCHRSPHHECCADQVPEYLSTF